MIKILKKIRAVPLVNFLMRNFIKFLIKIGINIDTTHFTVSGIVKIKLPNNKKIKLFSKGDDFIPSQVYWKAYDGYEYSIVPFYYLSLYSKTIIDIGANIGYYSLVAATANNKSNIYAFEPVDRIVKRFQKQIQINGFSNINIEQEIVGNTEEKIKFFIPKGNTMALAASTKKGWVKNTDELMIDSVTLDNYKLKKNIKKIDLIKMDCEFHELEVLQGMKQILKNDRPDILMEILMPEAKGVKGYFENNQYIDIEKILIEEDYYFYQITKDKLIRVDKLVYNKYDRNYLLSTKKSKSIEFLYENIFVELIN